jgi:N6-adenosine-specific RNA methylase IME4
MKSGAAFHYQTMPLADICALPVPSISAKNSVLFLWTTTPLLDYGLAVMKAWGFKYKTTLYWVKEGRKGLGYYFNGDVEPCLVGTRGTIKAFRTNKSNVIRARPRKHSQKPEEFFQLIEPVISQFEVNLPHASAWGFLRV